MIDEELLNKFDRIQDLPISEEMLGAYMEGNLDYMDSSLIETVISSDKSLSDFMSSVTESQNDMLEFSGSEGYLPSSAINEELPETEPWLSLVDSSSIHDEFIEFLCVDENDSICSIPDSNLESDSFDKDSSIAPDSFPFNSHSLDTDSSNDDETLMDNSIDF